MRVSVDISNSVVSAVGDFCGFHFALLLLSVSPISDTVVSPIGYLCGLFVGVLGTFCVSVEISDSVFSDVGYCGCYVEWLVLSCVSFSVISGRSTFIERERQTDRQAGRQAGRQADRQTDRQRTRLISPQILNYLPAL